MMKCDVSAVICTWNNKKLLMECLESLRAQERKPSEIIVVDNHSVDGSIEMVRSEFPDTILIVFPDSGHGACEAFNKGFAAARNEYIAILDDDVVLPKNWIRDLLGEFEKEPESTAIISTKVIEPNMPESFINSKKHNSEYYMSTFRGCGSMAKKSALQKAGYYPEEFFIFGNERDLSAKLLNLGYRIKQCPKIITYHRKPFGIRMGRRSLYYHVRNNIWYVLKYYSPRNMIGIVMYMSKMALGGGNTRNTSVGTEGLSRLIFRERYGIPIFVKAVIAASVHIPYCLRNRQVCKSRDFKLPFEEGDE